MLADAEQQHDVDAPTRRIEYLLAIPDAELALLCISFSALDFTLDSNDLTPMLIELFDAIVCTLRWTRRPTVPPAPADSPA